MNDLPNRLDATAYWWSEGFPGLDTLSPEDHQALQIAFTEVLRALPPEHFATFEERAPSVVCVVGARGATWAEMRPAPAVGVLEPHYTIYIAGHAVRRLATSTPPDRGPRDSPRGPRPWRPGDAQRVERAARSRGGRARGVLGIQAPLLTAET